MEQLGSHRTDFGYIWCLRRFRKSLENNRVSLKSDKNNGYFTWSRFRHLWYLADFFLEREIFRIKVVEKMKIHILYSVSLFSENRADYEIMSKNVVEADICWYLLLTACIPVLTATANFTVQGLLENVMITWVVMKFLMSRNLNIYHVLAFLWALTTIEFYTDRISASLMFRTVFVKDILKLSHYLTLMSRGRHVYAVVFLPKFCMHFLFSMLSKTPLLLIYIITRNSPVIWWT